MKKSLLSLAASALVLGPAGAVGADTVTDWNAAALDAIRADRTNPPRATRNMALMNASIFDAVNGIENVYQHYLVAPAAPAGAAPEAAAAAAAHRILSTVYPDQQSNFDALLASSLAAVPDGAAEDDGVAWGEQVADAILALREGDGSDVVPPYAAPDGAGWWIPTPPAFLPALLPNWATVTPWTFDLTSRFRQPAPPPLTSAEYAAAFNEVRRLGRFDSTFRTADQSEVAQFWDDGPGTATPPGHWNQIAQILSAEQGLTLLENARLFALLGLTVADAAIVSWDNKFHWDHWRPYTGIRKADTDANDQTAVDAGWESFINNPPFPAYTSGHSTFSGSSSRLLELFFGTDDIAFDAPTDGQPTGAIRSFDSLSQAAEEAGQSRIYGGIHWQYDNTGGLSSGRALAEHVFFNYLRPRGSTASCVADGETLCLAGGRFAVTAAWRTRQGTAGAGEVFADGNTAGRIWFFNPANTELVVKVIDACSEFGHFWVFVAGVTDVEVQLTVTDTQTGAVRDYFNPQRRDFEPVLDTTAFATCP